MCSYRKELEATDLDSSVKYQFPLNELGEELMCVVDSNLFSKCVTVLGSLLYGL